MEFVIAGAAAAGAGFFSNPLEVLKTRMQLQGELQSKGAYQVHYKNTLHAAYTVIKHDGILSLQKGLAPALWVQFLMNGIRLGMYDLLEKRGFVLDRDGNTVMYKCALVGGIGSVVGQIFVNPIFLVKTHLQTQAADTIAVGFQHKHTGTMTALQHIYQEQGVRCK